MSIPLGDVLLQMLGYTKFMKELLKKKHVIDVDMVEVFHHTSIVIDKQSSYEEKINSRELKISWCIYSTKSCVTLGEVSTWCS